LQEELARHGIARERVLPVSRCSHRQYLAMMSRIDIALDPFPYNGQNTSYDVLLMGLPLLTLAAGTPASRVGLGLMSNLGLTELVATDSDEYASKGAVLAADTDRLVKLRATLRERVNASPLLNEEKLVRRIESAYRSLWVGVCS
jgi:protein O-GlcNAc transferase